ncbi:hypothetical protein PV682_17425 [Streptomyces niveiscabiei]|uniref:alpha/beta fold hydrolase n=1 Tax=Streptomyces niveiscabiei TaxID=164115 RepID=UPI0029AC39A9|nr:hypothetical protein [Streptomyces niveiscabiei]MDX3383233.1 hypothetical protein [Streptomyces niveiscabiei]
MHVNWLPAFPPEDPAELAGLTDAEKARPDGYQRFSDERSGCTKLQSTRSQPLSFSLRDSPVGRLAWIVAPFRQWTDSRGLPEDAVDRDPMPSTGSSSARFYKENAANWGSFLHPLRVAVFAHEISRPVRKYAERTFGIARWTEFDHGGHFAAMEAPEDLVAGIRAFFSGAR